MNVMYFICVFHSVFYFEFLWTDLVLDFQQLLSNAVENFNKWVRATQVSCMEWTLTSLLPPLILTTLPVKYKTVFKPLKLRLAKLKQKLTLY